MIIYWRDPLGLYFDAAASSAHELCVKGVLHACSSAVRSVVARRTDLGPPHAVVRAPSFPAALGGSKQERCAMAPRGGHPL